MEKEGDTAARSGNAVFLELFFFLLECYINNKYGMIQDEENSVSVCDRYGAYLNRL